MFRKLCVQVQRGVRGIEAKPLTGLRCVLNNFELLQESLPQNPNDIFQMEQLASGTSALPLVATIDREEHAKSTP